MGFGYEVLQQLNPKIIMVNASAYGQFGPYSEKIGYGPIGECISGVAMTLGEEGWPPVQARVSLIDRTTALHAAIGVLSALRERDNSGLGQTIDICLADSGTALPKSLFLRTPAVASSLNEVKAGVLLPVVYMPAKMAMC